MRLSQPRIEPVDLGRLDADQRAALEPFLASDGGKVGGGRILNIFRTLANAPKALTSFLAWGGYILSKRNALSAQWNRPQLWPLALLLAAIAALAALGVRHYRRHEAQTARSEAAQ